MTDLDSTSSSEIESTRKSKNDSPRENRDGFLFLKKVSDEKLEKSVQIYKKNSLEKGLTKDKRTTVQQVLDKRTYLRLKRLHGRGIFDVIYGTISTGKEANVYEAQGSIENICHLMAIKVYKTSILVFRDRAKYIEGEFRYRRGYVGTNPRKMVNQWAEKEFRNLRRISLSGVYCPSPIALKDHILVMELIQGDDGTAAKKLKDLPILSLKEWLIIYSQVISIMRTLYQECKLIHADLSSYNMLYSQGRVYIIDVSQAVENDHPNAMYFLKRDCENVTHFFASVGYSPQPESPFPNHVKVYPDPHIDHLTILTSLQLFYFITKDSSEIFPNFCANSREIARRNSIITQVETFVKKMCYTSKHSNLNDLQNTILAKRDVFKKLCGTVYGMINDSDSKIFVKIPDAIANENITITDDSIYDPDEPKVDKLDVEESYISNDAIWNSLKPLNLSQISLETLERLDHLHISSEPIYPNSESDRYSITITETESGHESQKEEKYKFTGKVPDGVGGKEWKKMVKEMNRERRRNKIPKHIKKGYKNKK